MSLYKVKLLLIISVLSQFMFGCASTIEENEEFKIVDCVFTDDFFDAAESIELDYKKMQNFVFAGDWLQGKYYDFSYLGNKETIYCSSNNQVESINLSGIKVFLRGFDSLNVNNYLVNTLTTDRIQTNAIQRVKDEMNFPNTADFPFLGWGFARWGNLYGVSGLVKAKNAFGVEADFKFSLIYDVEDNSTRLVHFVLGGKQIFGEKPSIHPERVENADNNQDDNSILLTEGLKGEYGREVILDGYSYIWYDIPEGNYSVTCEVRVCKVYLDKNKTIKNSDGYTESVNVKTLSFLDTISAQELTISKEQHIELTIGSKVRLRKK